MPDNSLKQPIRFRHVALSLFIAMVTLLYFSGELVMLTPGKSVLILIFYGLVLAACYRFTRRYNKQFE